MRSAWLPVGLVLLGAVSAPLACGEVFQSSGGTTAGGGSAAGGTGGTVTSGPDMTTSMSSGNGGSTGAGGCVIAKDCPEASTLCGKVTCTDGVCGVQILQPDGKSFSQVDGDCHVVECDKGALVNKVDDKDVYNDGNDCTANACTGGVASTTPRTGEKCGNASFCSAAGACVACLKDGDCMSAGQTCRGNKCVGPTCSDGVKNFDEADVDCGGKACAPCDDGKECSKQEDCVSKVCSVKPGEAVKTCHHDCNDGVINGTETGSDCGGSVCLTRCAFGDGCAVHGDCKSGVCKLGQCEAPKCTDGVMNGTEAGVDCGTGCPKSCP